jgi:F420-dependent oxidoreductase-like protein
MRTRAGLGLLGGALLLASSLAHALLGWPQMRTGLRAGGADPELIAGLGVGWHFGSLSMAAFGAIVLAIAGARLGQIARAADEGGFASLWLMDHFFQIPMVGPAEQDMLESYTTLGFLAAHTRRLRLGTMVTGVTYRHPGLLVKTATTLDVLSSGRAYLGIGAAWFEREHRGLGVPFPPLAERFERLEETLRIAKQMWSEGSGGFEGRHYRLAETLNAPQALSRPHPPILIGGLGERKTLRLVARYADACNLFEYIGTRGLRQKLDVLARHCDAERRDYGAIEKTTLGRIDLREGKMTTKDVVEHCRALARLGIDHAIFSLQDVHELRPLETLARKVLPELAEL